MIEEAKVETVQRIKDLHIADELTKPVVDWVNHPDTIFGPNDIDEIIQNLKDQHDPAQESHLT
jgi:hypothetical protein